MYGMTREEAAEKALAYDRLKADVVRLYEFLLSTAPTGYADEVMRTVASVLPAMSARCARCFGTLNTARVCTICGKQNVGPERSSKT